MRIDAGGEITIEVHQPPHPGLSLEVIAPRPPAHWAVVVLSAREALALAAHLEAAAEGVKAGDEITEVIGVEVDYNP